MVFLLLSYDRDNDHLQTITFRKLTRLKTFPTTTKHTQIGLNISEKNFFTVSHLSVTNTDQIILELRVLNSRKI